MSDYLNDLPISEKSKYLCKINSLDTIEDILIHYVKREEFKYSEFADKNILSEIEDFSKNTLLTIINILQWKIVDIINKDNKEYRKKREPTGEKENDFKINIRYFKLSGKSQEACFNSSLFTLEDVYNYYQTNKNFMIIRNIGKKTNAELVAFCEKYSKE